LYVYRHRLRHRRVLDLSSFALVLSSRHFSSFAKKSYRKVKERRAEGRVTMQETV